MKGESKKIEIPPMGDGHRGTGGDGMVQKSSL